MRSPSRQARTVSARASPVTLTSPGAPGMASTSQSPKRARPGTGSVTGSGAAASRARVKRIVPYSTTALSPPPRSSAFVPRPPSARIRSASPAPSSPPACSASRRSTSRRTAGAAPSAESRHGRSAAQLLQRGVHRRVQHLRLLAQLARRLGDRPLRRRPDRAQRVQQVVAHARAREAAIRVGRVLPPFEPPRAQLLAHLLARHPQQRPHEPPAAGRHPVQGARAR